MRRIHAQFVRPLCWMGLAGLGWLAAPAHAQLPQAPEPVPAQIEMWHGLRRAMPSRPSSILKKVETPKPQMPSVPVAPVAATPAPGAGDSKAPLLSLSVVTLDPCPASPRLASSRLASPRLTPPAKADSEEASSPPEPAKERKPAAPASPKREPARTPYDQELFAALPGGGWTWFAASLLLPPLGCCLVLALFLRRHGGVMRVELHNPTGNAMTPDKPASAQAAPQPAPTKPVSAAARSTSDVPKLQDDKPAPQRFDVGPTYAQERAQREEQQQRQDQALLQRVFEDNLQLRKALGHKS